MKKEKGITLVALIVTIIILIILSAITINSTLGEHGLIDIATEAAIRSRIAEYKEGLDQIGIMVVSENVFKNLTGREYLEKFKEKVEESDLFKDKKSAEILGKEEGEEEEKLRVVTKEGYVFDVTEEEIKYIGSLGDQGFEPLPEIQTGSLIITLEPELESGTWTKNPYTVTIKVKEELTDTLSGFTIQYTTDSDPSRGQWKTYSESNKPKMTTNGTITARLKNNIGDTSEVTATKTINNIDTITPEEPTVIQQGVTSSSITINVTAKDGAPDASHPGERSGIEDIKYEIKEESAEKTAETDHIGSSETAEADITKSHTFESLKQNTPYTITVTAVDKAGNQRSKEINVRTKAIPGGNGDLETGAIQFSYSPDTDSGWTNSDVKVTITANYDGMDESDGYTIQYSKETNPTNWEDYGNVPVTMTTNGPIFARLKDRTGQTGATATANVHNIDKVAPSVPTNITTTVSDVTQSGKKNDLTVNASAHDTDPTEGHIAELSGIDGLKFSTDGQHWTDIDANANDASVKTATTIFNELSDNVYTVQVKAYDHAGNESQVATAQKTNVDTTPPTKPTITPTGTKVGDEYTTDIHIKITPGTDTALGTTGVRDTTYNVTGPELKSGTIANGQTAEFDLTKDGEYNITATSTDNAGNAQSNTIQVRRKRSTIEDKVTADNYGDKVNYPVDLDNNPATADWEIFYKNASRKNIYNSK